MNKGASFDFKPPCEDQHQPSANGIWNQLVILREKDEGESKVKRQKREEKGEKNMLFSSKKTRLLTELSQNIQERSSITIPYKI